MKNTSTSINELHVKTNYELTLNSPNHFIEKQYLERRIRSRNNGLQFSRQFICEESELDNYQRVKLIGLSQQPERGKQIKTPQSRLPR